VPRPAAGRPGIANGGRSHLRQWSVNKAELEAILAVMPNGVASGVVCAKRVCHIRHVLHVSAELFDTGPRMSDPALSVGVHPAKGSQEWQQSNETD
jgi:hypothetical protein